MGLGEQEPRKLDRVVLIIIVIITICTKPIVIDPGMGHHSVWSLVICDPQLHSTPVRLQFDAMDCGNLMQTDDISKQDISKFTIR